MHPDTAEAPRIYPLTEYGWIEHVGNIITAVASSFTVIGCGWDLQGRGACGWRNCGAAMSSAATSRRPGCWARCWARCRWTRSTSKPCSGQQGPNSEIVESVRSLACSSRLKWPAPARHQCLTPGVTCANLCVLNRRLQLPVTAPAGVHRGLRAAQADLGITVCVGFHQRIHCMLCSKAVFRVGMH